ncbi:hypothetical protein DRO57_06630 [Candidatus Bathyarchaeota archaeon]|nr:MAG: hypothetical protein DRO57_06630 [Candidatus Bathyarchaeota archaeon]
MGEEKEKRRSKDIEDIEELRTVLKVVREEVPPLIRGIVDPLKEILGITLTEEQARQRARAIAVMYKELVNAGMPPQDAMRIVETQTVNLTALVKDLLQGVFGESMAKRGRREEAREISREIKEQVKKAIEGKLEKTEE